jgi:hypothetical protein
MRMSVQLRRIAVLKILRLLVGQLDALNAAAAADGLGSGFLGYRR